MHRDDPTPAEREAERRRRAEQRRRRREDAEDAVEGTGDLVDSAGDVADLAGGGTPAPTFGSSSRGGGRGSWCDGFGNSGSGRGSSGGWCDGFGGGRGGVSGGRGSSGGDCDGCGGCDCNLSLLQVALAAVALVGRAVRPVEQSGPGEDPCPPVHLPAGSRPSPRLRRPRGLRLPTPLRPSTWLRLSTLLSVVAVLLPHRAGPVVAAAVRVYQRRLTRWTPACPGTPSCSAFALTAVETLGARRGLVAAAAHLRACGPAGPA